MAEVKLLTVGVMAARLGVRVRQVQYVLTARGIAPAARAGTLRLFDNAAFARVEGELRKIAARRRGGQ